MIQVIKYKCCDNDIEAALEPECYFDEFWLEIVRDYVSKGHKVVMIENRDLKLRKCKCDELNKIKEVESDVSM